MGIDTNVFNDPRTPREEGLHLYPVAQTEFWLRMGRTWLSGTIREDMVWFKNITDERSANSSYAIGWKVPLTV